jgi:opacity protein-like surface antigen
MKKFLAASALLLAGSAFAAAAPNLTGEWNIHNNIAGNESDQSCKFVLADNKLTGTCKSPEDKDISIAGTIDGNKLTWQYESEYNGTPLTLTYTATLDDSGKIAGSVEVQPFGVTGDFTATPKSAAK